MKRRSAAEFDRKNPSARLLIDAQDLRASQEALMNNFRIRGLPAKDFTPLFSMSDPQLAEFNARRVTALDGGYPCRVSLTDATPGDSVILVNY